MQNEQGTNEAYGKSSHDFARRMVIQNDACSAQYACYEYEEAQPPYGVVSEKSAEGHQSAYHRSGAGHMRAEFPPQVDDDTDAHYHHRGKDNVGHVPWNVEPVHHQQAEDVGSDGQYKRYVPFLSVRQIIRAEAVDFAKDENRHRGHQDGEAIDHAQYNQLVLQRHDAQV